MTDEKAEIAATVMKYINGIAQTNTGLIMEAFREDAVMTGHFGGSFTSIPGAARSMKEYMDKLPPTTAHSPNFQGRVTTVGQFGTLGYATTEENGLEGKDMRSVFILHKIGGEWLIVSKGTWAPD